jgi:hypothetical protein
MGRNNKNQCFLVAFYFSVFLFYNTSLGHHNILSRKWRYCEAIAGWKQKNVQIMKEVIIVHQCLS